MMQATHAELVAAFDAWENEFRANPDGFYTADEVAALEVASLSESRAIAFTAYLRQVRGTVVESGAETQPKTAETRENTSVDDGGQKLGRNGWRDCLLGNSAQRQRMGRHQKNDG